jgi:hypothetical protein
MTTAGEISGTGKRYYDDGIRRPRHTEDWYIEPPWTVDLLLEHEDFTGDTWDPACGSGTIPEAFAQRDQFIFASDIVDRGCPGMTRRDFLATLATTDDVRDLTVDNIITNPPYRLAEAFARRALDLARKKVAILVQAKFLFSQRRHVLFTTHPPARLYFLSTRPSMPPGDLLQAGEIEAKGGKVDYLWVVWDHEDIRPTQARWLLR